MNGRRVRELQPPLQGGAPRRRLQGCAGLEFLLPPALSIQSSRSNQDRVRRPRRCFFRPHGAATVFTACRASRSSRRRWTKDAVAVDAAQDPPFKFAASYLHRVVLDSEQQGHGSQGPSW